MCVSRVRHHDRRTWHIGEWGTRALNWESSADGTHNEYHGDADIVVQLRDVYGSVYLGSQRAPQSRRAASGWLALGLVLAVAAAALIWLAVGHWHDEFGIWCLAPAGILVGGVFSSIARALRWWVASRPINETRLRHQLNRAAEGLADTLRTEWEREERLRRLQDPDPLPVRWNNADPLLTDHWANIHRDEGRKDPLNLAGSTNGVAEMFDRVPSGRLVVLGPAGGGKTVLALRFVLDQLSRRRSGDPVPVILSLASWNPSERELFSWAASRLSLQYPELGMTAEVLLRTRRVFLVLDGFDELPPPFRAEALRRLNMDLGRDDRVLLTSRTDEYASVVRETDVFTSAAVVELQPLPRANMRIIARLDHLSGLPCTGKLTCRVQRGRAVEIPMPLRVWAPNRSISASMSSVAPTCGFIPGSSSAGTSQQTSNSSPSGSWA